MKLRDYQQAAVDAVIACWRRNIRRCLVVLPTGCGKTVVFGEIVRRIRRGLASIPQTRYLRRHGIGVPMSFAETSRTITRLLHQPHKIITQ